MQACDYSPYILPTIDFIAGESQDLLFHTYFHTGRRPFDLTGCSCSFAVVNFLNRTGSPILSKSMSIGLDPSTDVYSQATVHLEPQETLDLSGKYIYQISIRNDEGDVEIPKQGILLITNNINKSFME